MPTSEEKPWWLMFEGHKLEIHEIPARELTEEESRGLLGLQKHLAFHPPKPVAFLCTLRHEPE